MIYLDNSATTKPDETVVHSFKQTAGTYFANPSSIHQWGAEVEQLQTRAREQAAKLMQVRPGEIVFTSGGTEGNNLAIKGIAFQHAQRGKHIITTEVEHASVYGTCQALEEIGYDVTYLSVNRDGAVQTEDIEAAIRPDTILVSVMHVNNEIGTVQPIKEIGELLKAYPKVFFHVDAVQALGKVPVQLTDTGIDLCTFSGHKIHGLKGTGCLYIKEGTTLFPLMHGGNQESGIRSGTENVAGNVSFVRALRLIMEKQQQVASLQTMRDTLWQALTEISGVHVTSPEKGAPHIVHVSVPGLKPEVMIHALFEAGFVVSTQSACSSKQSEKSRVLTACGYGEDMAYAGLRISLTYDQADTDIDAFIQVFQATIIKLKEVMR